MNINKYMYIHKYIHEYMYIHTSQIKLLEKTLLQSIKDEKKVKKHKLSQN